MQCSKCKKVLAKKGSHFVCQGICQGVFHRSCVKGLAADMKAGKTRIYCNNCDEEETEEEPEPEEPEEVQFGDILKDIQKKVSAIPGLNKRLDSIERSLSLLSDKYDSLMMENKQTWDRITKLEKIAESTSNKCIYLEKCNQVLEQKLQDYEQASRKNNIEIVGIEQLPDENLLEIVTKIGDKINAGSKNIETVRRTRKVGNKPSPIIVEFKTTGTTAREEWLGKRRNLNKVTSLDITGGSLKDNIFINEDLTKPTRTLLWNTKQKLKGVYRCIWVSNGKILVKKEEGDKSKWVRSDKDIDELLKDK